jgi:hypothetical protein
LVKKEKVSMASVEEILDKLKEKAKPDQLEGMTRYGMSVEKRLGVAVPEMRKIAKAVGWDTRSDDPGINDGHTRERYQGTDGRLGEGLQLLGRL